MRSLDWALGLTLGHLHLQTTTTTTFQLYGSDQPVRSATEVQPVGPSNIVRAVAGPLLPHNWNPYPSFTEALSQWCRDSKILGTWSRANRMLHIKCLELKTVSLSPHWASVTAPPGHDCYGQYQGSRGTVLLPIL